VASQNYVCLFPVSWNLVDYQQGDVLTGDDQDVFIVALLAMSPPVVGLVGGPGVAATLAADQALVADNAVGVDQDGLSAQVNPLL
jgi:hypothetical protein